MNGLSDGITKERMQREANEMKMEDRLERVENELQEARSAVDSLTRNRLRIRTRDSIKDMERKVGEAHCSLKLLDVDIGRVTEDRREIVKGTIEETRRYVKEGDLRLFDSVMRRTRIVVMGKGTTRWEKGSASGFSVPTLFQCRDRRDQEDLEGIIRAAGYFPLFHWPKEMLDFVTGVREEVVKMGCDPERNYIRVRPELRDGRLQIKAEIRKKEVGGRFSLKGVWACPPLERGLWDDVPDLFQSKLATRG